MRSRSTPRRRSSGSGPSARRWCARSSATSSRRTGRARSSDREELLSAFPERKVAEEVLREPAAARRPGELIDARLLTTYEVEGAEGQPSHHRVEVVHESLLKAWPRLVRWQAQDEEGALLRDQLKQAAHLWEEKGRTSDLLWTGTAFQEFELWRGRYAGRADGARGGLRPRDAREGAPAEAADHRGRRVGDRGRSRPSPSRSRVSRQQAARARTRRASEALRAEASQLVALGRRRARSDPTVTPRLRAQEPRGPRLGRGPAAGGRGAVARARGEGLD